MERVVGFHPVREALRARRRQLGRLLYREGLRRRELGELLGLARSAGIPAEAVPPAELARNQVLYQAGVSVMAQANQLPASVLQLLQ